MINLNPLLRRRVEYYEYPWATALRFTATAGLLVLGLVSAMDMIRAEGDLRCPESGMPIETLGSDMEQRQFLYQQAKAWAGSRCRRSR